MKRQDTMVNRTRRRTWVVGAWVTNGGVVHWRRETFRGYGRRGAVGMYRAHCVRESLEIVPGV